MLKALYDLFFLALTVEMEAGGEPLAGKIAVAHVIMNRSILGQKSIQDTILARKQFSSWNDDDPVRMTLDTPPSAESFAASCSAYFSRTLGTPDPTGGATHYLNVELTKKIRGGTLPDWYDPKKVSLVVGRHQFLRLP